MGNNSKSSVVYQGKIPGRVKYTFAFGALGKDLIYGMIATFSMIYFTDIIKVAPAFIGTMFFVAKIWDAFNDLFMGMIVDNTRSRFGKFVPWLVIGTLINAFVFVTVFTDFHLTGVKRRFIGEKKLVQPDKARYVYEISRYIEYVENGNMKSGVLLLEYYTDSIDEVLLHYKSQKSAYCYLLDTNRRLLYHPFEKEIASEMYQEKTVKEAMACKNYKIEEQSGGKWLIERQQIGYTGWNVVLVNSMSSLDFESYNLHYVAWFTLLLVGVILIFLDILLFRSFTDPVYRLLQTMQEFGKGNYDIKAKEEGIGELKNLSAHFNIMADKLQEQMEEIRRNERERQQMEKKLLQSQINPHFLYNTLDSIIWMIRSEEYEGAGKMVSLLAKFFRISLSQGKDMIPLEKELEHASSYLAIQNIRFKDKFEFQIEADPALLKYLCPKLSIQPLLENAIYHGMEGMYEDGEITIRIYDRDGDIGIDVADNGPGMTQETIDHIMHNKVISSKRGSGIGVRNVNERIQLIYGEDYGVTITSELDEGTTATITIPKMEETDDAR